MIVMLNYLCIHDLNRISYKEAFLFQTDLRNRIKQGQSTPFHLVYCEHYPVLTKGRNFEIESMPYPDEFYLEKNITIENVDRGGGVTFHGPGQITAYFIFDLNQTKKDIHYFIHQLEEIVINCLKDFQVIANRHAINTGVWVKDEKICAIGIGFKHWISYHGIGFNINTDMKYFNDIIPCGLKNIGVTSLKRILHSSENINLDLVKEKITFYANQTFKLQNKNDMGEN